MNLGSGPGNPLQRLAIQEFTLSPGYARAEANEMTTIGMDSGYQEKLRLLQHANRTISNYKKELRRFLRFHQKNRPRSMGGAEINAFLSHLAME